MVTEKEIYSVQVEMEESTATSTSDDDVDDDDESNAGADDDENRTTSNFDDAKEDKEFCILGEIVGGYHLTYRDNPTTADDDDDDEMGAFVRVCYGTKVIHQTMEADPGWNPIWSPISTDNLFLLHTTPRELAHQNLRLSVRFNQKDSLQLTVVGTLKIGTASLDGKSILAHCDEKHFKVNLHGDNPKTSGMGTRGSLTLRLRLASHADKAFVQMLQSQRRSMTSTSSRNIMQTEQPIAPILTEQDETKVIGASFVQAVTSVFTSKSYFDKRSGQHKVLVKPHPDPSRVKSTTYLSAKEIMAETMKPSHQWVNAGSGTLGKLHLEILKCDDLPNVDVGEAVGNFSDCFVCAVFEDAMCQTPVIDDELSPRWLPWIQRAFIFGMTHPASILYLGVFDFDLGLQNHEAIGRVAVNIGNLQSQTDYTLRYNLYKSSSMTDRMPSGSITIRLRLEYSDEKAALLAGLLAGPRPKFHVNVRREKSLAVVNYTCWGEGDHHEHQNFDLTVLRSYINEILVYKRVLAYRLGDTLWSLVFWEGQVRLFNISLPIHSFLLFCSLATLVERPYMAPSFFLLSVAWILLAIQTRRLQHPSPWRRCKSFRHYLTVLLNRSSMPIEKIDPYEGAIEAESYEKDWEKRVTTDNKVAATKQALQEEMNIIGDETIHTKKEGGIPLDLVVRLSRYQGILARICRFLRYIKVIVTWEEEILAFWITSLFLAGGLVSLLLPWSFILFWMGRILVWGLLGPHMKIVGLIFNSHFAPTQEADEKIVQRVIETFRKKSRSARLRHQEAKKLKELRCLEFGEYSTLIPSFNLCRHYDYALPESFARLHHSSPSNEIQIASAYIPGQQCSDGIIPRTQLAVQKHNAEVNELQRLLEVVTDCVNSIQEAEGKDVIPDNPKSLISQEDIPDAMGYEMISLRDHMNCAEGNLPVLVRDFSSSAADPEHDVTKLLDKLGLQDLKLFCCYEYESNNDASDDSCQFAYSISPMNSLLLDTETKVAILDTFDWRQQSSTLSVDVIGTPVCEDKHLYCIEETTSGFAEGDVVEVVLAGSSFDVHVLCGDDWKEAELLSSSDMPDAATEYYYALYR